MRASPTVLLIALPLLAACAGTTPTTVEGGSTGSGAGGAGGAGATSSAEATTSASTGAGQDGRAYFETNVSPIADAACASCHSSEFTDAYAAPDFLGGAAGEYYDSLVGNVKYVNSSPDSSVFLKKGLHTGPAFTASEAELVETWLAIEAEARFGGGSSSSATTSTGSGGNPTGPTAEEGMQAFGDCMTLDDWKASGIQMVGAQSTLADGVCHKCHASGTAANYMTSTISEAAILDGFENMRYGAPLQKLVTWTLDPTTGAFTDIVQSYRWQDKGGEGSGHPKYVLMPQYADAIDAWFDLAYAKWKSGACGGVPGGT